MRIIPLLLAVVLFASCQNNVQQEPHTTNNETGTIKEEADASGTEVENEIDALKDELEKTKAALKKKSEQPTAKKAPPTKARQVDHYICYTNDDKKEMRIWISFDKDGKAVQVKYEGQKKGINLTFNKEDYKEGNAYPTTTTYYKEIYGGKVNGKYKLTHAGIWDYTEYTRAKDGKVFNFTIDHDANPYGKEPCF